MSKKHYILIPLLLLPFFFVTVMNSIKDPSGFQKTLSYITQDPQSGQILMQNRIPGGAVSGDALKTLLAEEFIQSALKKSSLQLHQNLLQGLEEQVPLSLNLTPFFRSIMKEVGFPKRAAPQETLFLTEKQSADLRLVYNTGKIASLLSSFGIAFLVIGFFYPKTNSYPLRFLAPVFLGASLLSFMIFLLLEVFSFQLPSLFLQYQFLTIGQNLLLISIPLFLLITKKDLYLAPSLLLASVIAYLVLPLLGSLPLILSFIILFILLWKKKQDFSARLPLH